MKLLLLAVAAIATIYAAASFFTHFDADFEVAVLAAILALGGVFVIEYLDAQHAWMARYREDVWHRREEEMER